MKKDLNVDKLPFFHYIRKAIIFSLIISVALNVKFYIDILAYKELLDISLEVPEKTIEELKDKVVEEIKESNTSKLEKTLKKIDENLSNERSD